MPSLTAGLRKTRQYLTRLSGETNCGDETRQVKLRRFPNYPALIKLWQVSE
jgi:hypothetical protein